MLGDRVQIINGKYFYDIQLSKHQYDEIISVYKRRMENRCKVIEKEIMDKTNKSLVDILHELEQFEKQILN